MHLQPESKTEEIKKKNSPLLVWDDARILQAFSEYTELGSYQLVSVKYGVTRERIRQILRKGEKRGLFTYETRYSSPSKKELIYLLKECGSKKALSERLGVGFKILNRWLKLNKINVIKVTKELHKEETITWYMQLWEKLQRQPTSTDLLPYRRYYARIELYFGSFPNFYDVIGSHPGYERMKEYHIARNKIFLANRAYTDEEFIDVVKNSSGIGEVINKLTRNNRSITHATFHREVERLKLDVSHFIWKSKSNPEGKPHSGNLR